MKIPINFQPRGYQIPFLDAMDSGKKRANCVWHRKSGKTLTLLNFTVKKAFERKGTYYHCFPEYGQGRKVLWDGMDNEGNKYLDNHIPPEIRKSINKAEMKIELCNGSIWQIIGADNYDSLVGPNPIGLVLDEWAVSPRYPQAWNYFRPILAQNNGWAVFVYTPRGRNHGWDTYQMSLTNPEWFSQLLTVDDTKAVAKSAIEAERRAGMPESMIQQEFYCSFLASVEGVLIPFEFIQSALRRDIKYDGLGNIAGYDSARFGDDRNAVVIRKAGVITHIDRWVGMDLVQSSGKIINMYRNKLFDIVAMDVIGIGAGVYDMVKSAGVPCVAVNVSESSSYDGRFRRLRDELWWKFREWFTSQSCSISRAIPQEIRDEFVADIQDIRYKFSDMGNLIEVESKKEMKKRLGFSPDLGDAACNTFHPSVESRVRDGILFEMVEDQVEVNPWNYLLRN